MGLDEYQLEERVARPRAVDGAAEGYKRRVFRVAIAVRDTCIDWRVICKVDSAPLVIIADS